MKFDIDINQVTQADVDRELYRLSQELDHYNEEAIRLRDIATWRKHEMEAAQREVRVELMKQQGGPRLAAQEKQDIAEERSKDFITQWQTAQLLYDACKQRMNTTREQIDVWRSIGASVRSSLNIQ